MKSVLTLSRVNRQSEKVYFLTLILFFTFLTSYAQRDRWLLYPTEHEPGVGSGNTYNWNIPTIYPFENFVYDEVGKLLFYVNNQGYFNRQGINFGATQFTYTLGRMKEIEILPVPGSCGVYCAIYAATSPLVSTNLFLEEVTIDPTGTPVLTNSSTFNDPGTGNPVNFTGNFAALAVSSILPGTDGDRHIYLVSSSKVHLLQMTNGGIISLSETNLPTELQSNRPLSEADLSPSQQYLVFGKSNNLVRYERATQTFTSFNAVGAVVGTEFSANSQLIYYCVKNVGIYRRITESDALPVFISGSISNSQLELGKDGNIYAVNNQGKLCYIKPDDSIVVTNQDVGSNANSHDSDTYALPQQVDGEAESLLQPILKPVLSNMTLNTQPLPGASGAPLPNFFDCGDLSLDFTMSGLATGYTISIASVNASNGQPNGIFSFSTTLPASSGPAFELKCLEAPINCDLLDGLGGQILKVTVVASNASNEDCPEESIPLIGYFSLSGPPTPATANLLLYSGLVGDPGCNAQQINNACKVGNTALSFDLSNSSGFITFYEINIQEVDCLLGNPTAILYDGPPTPINGVGSLQNVNLNTLMINGNFTYFSSNPGLVDGRCFRIEATVGNDCGQSTSFSYFFVDPALPRPDPEPGIAPHPLHNVSRSAMLVYPNPFRETAVLKASPGFSGGEARIYAADGREINRFILPLGATEYPIQLHHQPAGLYILRIVESGNGTSTTIPLLHHDQ